MINRYIGFLLSVCCGFMIATTLTYLNSNRVEYGLISFLFAIFLGYVGQRKIMEKIDKEEE